MTPLLTSSMLSGKGQSINIFIRVFLINMPEIRSRILKVSLT